MEGELGQVGYLWFNLFTLKVFQPLEIGQNRGVAFS